MREYTRQHSAVALYCIFIWLYCKYMYTLNNAHLRANAGAPATAYIHVVSVKWVLTHNHTIDLLV